MSKSLTPVRAIRAKCLDCSAGQPSEVKMCTHTDCSLYLYRYGKNPNRKGLGGRQNSLVLEKTTDSSSGFPTQG